MRALSIAATGMTAQQMNVEVIANNHVRYASDRGEQQVTQVG